MEGSQMPLRDLIVTLNPQRVEVTPKTGWEIIADKSRQEITMQVRFLGLRLPWKYRYPFSRVVAINGVTSNLWQEMWVPISGGGGPGAGMPTETLTEHGAARKRKQAIDLGIIHRIVITIESAEPIKINGYRRFQCTVTPGYDGPSSVIRDIRELEMILAKLICI